MILTARLSWLSGSALFCIAYSTLAKDAAIEQSNTVQSNKIETHLEFEHTMTLEMKPPPSHRCQVRVTMDYLQKDTVAKVDSLVENKDCAASSGSFTVSVRIRDENGEMQKVEYDETWQREDDQPITISKEYFAGENVDIIRVQARKLQCLCAEVLPEDKE